MTAGKFRPKIGDRSIDATLLDFDRILVASKKAPQTVEIYRFALGKFRKFALARGKTKLRDINPNLIVDFVAHHSDKLPNTIVNYLARLRHFLKRCVENGERYFPKTGLELRCLAYGQGPENAQDWTKEENDLQFTVCAISVPLSSLYQAGHP